MEIISRPCSDGPTSTAVSSTGIFVMRRGDLFYPMRKKFHYQAETGEGARQLDRNSAAIWRMNFGFAFPTSSEGRARAPIIS